MDPQNTISQQQLCCGGQEGEPDGRIHPQNCDSQTVISLYNALVRPPLVWSPYLKKDILSIEKVQQRVTDMIPSVSALTHEQRLKRTGLMPLENRRLKADLLEVFKTLKGFVKVDPATHFSVYKLEATACSSWPSDNLKDVLTGKSQINTEE